MARAILLRELAGGLVSMTRSQAVGVFALGMLLPLLTAVAIAVALLTSATAQATTVFGFEGTSQLSNCALSECFRPPDTMGAIGTTQFMETSNGSITVYDRTNGAVQSRVSMATFWANVGLPGGGNGDQRVLFDHYTNRWIAIGFGSVTSTINLAVSDTSNALGTWKSTAIVGIAGTTLDYPTLGIDNKGVYIGTNNFSPGFGGTSLFSIPKADLFGGAPTVANMTRFDTPLVNPDRGFAIQGAVNWGGNPSNTANIMTVSRDQFDVFTYKLNGVNAAGATQTAVNELNVTGYAFPRPGRQPDGTRLVDTLDDRISANVYEANGKLYAIHTVAPNATTGSFSELRWYVVNTATGALIESGTIGGFGFDYFQGSIAVNEFGQAVVAYNRSGPQTADTNGDGKEDGRISLFAWVFDTDGAGGLDAVGDPFLLRVSDVNDYRCGVHTVIDTTCRQRWGDYAAVTIDPLDHHQFWAIGEYADDWALLPGFESLGERAVWHTYIAGIDLGQQVPEPGTLALILLGVAMAGIARRHGRE